MLCCDIQLKLALTLLSKERLRFSFYYLSFIRSILITTPIKTILVWSFIFAYRENNKFILQNDFECIICIENRGFDVPKC